MADSVAPREHSRLGRVRVARFRYSLFAHSLAPAVTVTLRFKSRHRSEQKRTYHDVVGSFLLAEMERFELSRRLPGLHP